MYSESDLLPISALQHLIFCERQCALIHLEQAWDENRLTAEGRVLHERVHQEDRESRRGVRTLFGLRLRSFRLGLQGQADVVELNRKTGEAVPIEYKRGRPKPDSSDAVQLCAQAICLEEMMDITIPAGALFYGKTRRRKDVAFDDGLRQETADAAVRLHDLIRSGRTPTAPFGPKCTSCSFLARCMPQTVETRSCVLDYLRERSK
jgi:CRISPR-associated exonuclease Cas4